MVVLPITILQLICSKNKDDFLAYSKTFSNLVVEVQVKVQVLEMFLVVCPTNEQKFIMRRLHYYICLFILIIVKHIHIIL